ncbi:hypothetical protein GLAREA_06426 [Glarea lozoyensis ATCC 20868]|uniref:Uncharacterized protein n=1 Tax=Glarea lozoyensis (strain ATCC 20868 / MF5171) TaxID=1116229 RepID=S3E4S0_GLAL2|nr:uncharacterized protein GLAREA_06426 [Glarea lozoyensis ATCC 20868]EPE33413.1 hypothetical protein GLAREA_06426 [Glarea lozoyensis ATCC 20868]
MPRTTPQSQPLFYLKAINKSAELVVADPRNSAVQSTLADGTPVLDIVVGIATKHPDNIGLTVGSLNCDIIVGNPEVCGHQCTFRLEPGGIILCDESPKSTTQVFGENAFPFDQIHCKRYYLAEGFNTKIGLGSTVGCGAVQFEVVWYPNAAQTVERLSEEVSLMKSDPINGGTIPSPTESFAENVTSHLTWKDLGEKERNGAYIAALLHLIRDPESEKATCNKDVTLQGFENSTKERPNLDNQVEFRRQQKEMHLSKIVGFRKAREIANASLPYRQFSCHIEAGARHNWRLDARTNFIDEKRIPERCVARNQAYETIKKSWVDQGIWRDEWQLMPTLGNTPDAFWKHESPPTVEFKDKGQQHEYERTRDASRPYFQFIYQVSQARQRIQEESGHVTRSCGADINTKAYETVREAWKEWAIWDDKWGMMPGMSWKHENLGYQSFLFGEEVKSCGHGTERLDKKGNIEGEKSLGPFYGFPLYSPSNSIFTTNVDDEEQKIASSKVGRPDEDSNLNHRLDDSKQTYPSTFTPPSLLPSRNAFLNQLEVIKMAKSWRYTHEPDKGVVFDRRERKSGRFLPAEPLQASSSGKAIYSSQSTYRIAELDGLQISNIYRDNEGNKLEADISDQRSGVRVAIQPLFVPPLSPHQPAAKEPEASLSDSLLNSPLSAQPYIPSAFRETQYLKAVSTRSRAPSPEEQPSSPKAVSSFIQRGIIKRSISSVMHADESEKGTVGSDTAQLESLNSSAHKRLRFTTPGNTSSSR